MENLPIELSADGKRNAFSHPCNVMGYRANFAVCINLMTKRKEGRLSPIYADCSAAIGKKTCPAIKMRKEELDKGQAIYFVERARSEAVINPVATPTFTRDNKSRVSRDISAKKPPKVIDILDAGAVDGGGISDAINNAFEEEQKRIETAKATAIETGKPEVIAQQVPKATLRPGESLLDMAKRIMEEKRKSQQGANV